MLSHGDALRQCARSFTPDSGPGLLKSFGFGSWQEATARPAGRGRTKYIIDISLVLISLSFWSGAQHPARGGSGRRNMSALDASHGAEVLGPSQAGARAAQAAQVANIAGRLERLPLTSYQKMIFAIIATAWFFDSMDLGALTFVLGSIRQTFQLSTAEAGLLSSMSFFGMFAGAASAGLLADRFGRTRVFQASMIFWGLGSLFLGLSSTVMMLGASRLLLGFGMGMEFPIAQSLVSEMMPAEQRCGYSAYLEG